MRPYYKPYRVGRQEYRGANAGDFSGINEIDLLLGLCRANDPYYAQLLVDKMLFMLPGGPGAAARLHDAHESSRRVARARGRHSRADWFQRNARAYLEVCDLFGRIAAQHHDELVKRFIEDPATRLPKGALEGSRRADRRCRCCCARSKCCATCGSRRIAPTSRRGTRISRGCAAMRVSPTRAPSRFFLAMARGRGSYCRLREFGQSDGGHY